MGWFPERMRGLIPGLSPAKRPDDGDDALLTRFAADSNAAAFTKLVERHSPMVYRVCRSVLGNEHDAEDATQATFLVLAKRARSIRQRGSVASWLHGVSLKTARNYQQRLIRDRQRAQSRPANPTVGDALDELTFREAREILHAELDKLPEKHKAPLVLVYLEEKSHEEAARALGLTPNVFRGRLERARDRLAEQLAGHKLAFASTMSAAMLLVQVPQSLAATVGGNVLGHAAGSATAGVSPLVAEVAGKMTSTVVTKASAVAAGIAATTTVAATVAVSVISPRHTPVPPAPTPEVSQESGPVWRYHAGHIVMASARGFYLLNPDGGDPTAISPPLPNGAIGRFRLAPDRQSLLFEHLTPEGHFLCLWRFADPFPGTRVGRDVQTFFYSPDSRRMLTTTSEPLTLRSQEMKTGEAAVIPLPETHTAIDLRPDGTTILAVIRPAGGGAAQLALVDAKNARTIMALNVGPAELAIQWRFSPDGRSVAGVKQSSANVIRPAVFDLEAGILREFTGEPSDRFYGWSPDGRDLLCGSTGPGSRLESIVIRRASGEAGPKILPVRVMTGETTGVNRLYGRPVWIDWQR